MTIHNIATYVRAPHAPSALATPSSRDLLTHLPHSREQFKETIAREHVVLVDAFATWCGPCKAIAPTIAKWAEELEFKNKVHFAKFDVDDVPELAQELGIRAMPTFIFFKDGEKVGEFVGGNPGPLKQLLVQHSSEV
ncbi:thioredoxin-like protein [Lasiosphaeria hispida]|uniref:Thioredoxin-like protein n=1 Tax=Lasiosphaeria hispida TaxID=260671 RepID=A0AAJ0HH08_9PEZI|nr:thioredoxin-like protein [Lasiosphaeria hispida]